MTYADYQYYKDDFIGVAIGEEDFPRYAVRASRYLDYITLNKARAVPDMPELKDVCCALAEQYQLIDTAGQIQSKSLSASVEGSGSQVKSETVGPWSRTYQRGGESAAAAAEMQENFERSLAEIARRYLAHTGLLYRGGGCWRCSHTT